jgi:hypothetical protein
MYLHSNFYTFFQVYTRNLIENLGRIERVGKVATIKQQIKSMCTHEALLEKFKTCRQETICSKMLNFLVQNTLKLTYEQLQIEQKFLGSLSLAMKYKGEPS